MQGSTLTIEEWKTEQQLFVEAVSVNSTTPSFDRMANVSMNDEFDPGSGQTLAA